MEPYHLTLAPAPGIAVLATAADVARPDEYLGTLEEELWARRICGTVVLDLLVANGGRNRRFFSINFDGKKFALLKFELIKEPDAVLWAAAAAALRRHSKEINFALVPPALRRELTARAMPAPRPFPS